MASVRACEVHPTGSVHGDQQHAGPQLDIHQLEIQRAADHGLEDGNEISTMCAASFPVSVLSMVVNVVSFHPC